MDTNIGIQATTECMKFIDRIGSTTWVNICTGKETVLPWGFTDWTMNSLLALLVLIVLGIIIGVPILIKKAT